MFRRKFIRLGAGLLMILALTLPVAGPVSAAHTVTGNTPTTGGTAGGQVVTITGTGFFEGGVGCAITSITFNGLLGTSISCTDTTATVTTPASPAGTGLPIVVTTTVNAVSC